MGFRYRDDVDILKMLKDAGYSSYKLQKERIFGQSTIQKFRDKNKLPSWAELNKLCLLLNCNPDDIIVFEK